MYPKLSRPHLDMSMNMKAVKAMDLEVEVVERGKNMIKHG